MYCTQCGRAFTDTERFCPSCGTPNQTARDIPRAEPGRAVEAQVYYGDRTTQQRGFIDNFLYVLKNALNFSGRAPRREFWLFVLASWLFGMCLSVISVGILFNLWLIVHFFASLSVAVRRLHDVGKSGWWYLLCMIPSLGVYLALLTVVAGVATGRAEMGFVFVGILLVSLVVILYMLYLFIKRGDDGPNQYGPDPLR